MDGYYKLQSVWLYLLTAPYANEEESRREPEIEDAMVIVSDIKHAMIDDLAGFDSNAVFVWSQAKLDMWQYVRGLEWQVTHA